MNENNENNLLEENNERFAAIFWRQINSKGAEQYSFESVTLLDFDDETGEYEIIGGNFEGLTQNSFGTITGAEDFIDGNNEEMKIVGDGKYKIYIFDNNYINKITNMNNWDILDTYVYLARKICEIKFTNINGKFYAQKEAISHYLPLEEIEKQLFEHYDDLEAKEVITINLSEILSQVLLGGVMFDDGETGLYLSAPQDYEEYPDKEESQDITPEVNEQKQIDVSSIIKEISNKIVGQDEAIKTLVTNIYFNQVLLDTLSKDGKIDETELDSRKVSILLDGSTGTGKTAIAKDIASKLELPIEIVNANSFSETGYVGPTITDILNKLLDQAKGNIKLAERGIVVLDEIDKLATNTAYEGRDMKQGVQEELLAFIGGGKYELESEGFFAPKTTFDTSKLTFIMSGAFTELRDRKIKEAKKNTVGFNSEDRSNVKTYTVTPQDYIEYGLLREFFGRIKVLTSTKTYSVEDLKEILLKSAISPLKNFEKTVKMFGYEGITYSDEFIEALAKKAYQMETGARGLQTIMSGIQNKMLIDLVTKNLDCKIELTKEMLEEYEKGNQRSY